MSDSLLREREESKTELYPREFLEDLAVRAERTLDIFHKWGYAPTADALAKGLLGGGVTGDALLASISGRDEFQVRDGHVYLKGKDELVEKSKVRVASNRHLNGEAMSIAEEFSLELLRFCPLVDCVAVSGSVASGGYSSGDDIDFDLVVRDGAKYLVYAMGLAVGARVAVRHRARYGFRKLICLNAIWTRSQTAPFVRRDEGLAFELLHCRPLFGSMRFMEMIERNEWVLSFFPQVAKASTDIGSIPEPNRLGRLILWIHRHPRLLRLAETAARLSSQVIYSLYHLVKRSDSEAAARFEFLRQAKYPYEFFQD